MSSSSSSAAASSSLVKSIDMEMKFLAVVFSFALVKFLGANYNSWFWTNLFRLIFIGCHTIMFLIYNKALSIAESRTLEEDRKSGRYTVRKLGIQLAVRIPIVLIIHKIFNLLPPLLVSSILGLMSLFENEYYYAAIITIAPSVKIFLKSHAS